MCGAEELWMQTLQCEENREGRREQLRDPRPRSRSKRGRGWDATQSQTCFNKLLQSTIRRSHAICMVVVPLFFVELHQLVLTLCRSFVEAEDLGSVENEEDRVVAQGPGPQVR